MIIKLAIIFLLGLQGSWAQDPNQNSEAPALPMPPEALPPVDLPPNTEIPSEIPGEGESDFVNAEIDTLKPTNRDPFAKPKSLIEKEVESVKPTLDPSVYIDMRIEPIRRFPIRNYILVGIIFDVENPKAMVKDPENNMHLLTTNQRIGNQEGLIIKIERGELVVEEKGKLVSLKLHK